MKYLSLFLIAFGCILKSYSVQSNIYTLDQSIGLSNNHIQSIIQSNDGSIWIGTHNGVNIFDGTQIQQLFAQDGLPSNNITCFENISDSVIWIGTDEGFCRYNLKRKSFIESISLPKTLGNTIRKIILDDQGNVWIQADHGVAQYDQDGLFQELYIHKSNDSDGLASNILTDIALDEASNLWVGTINKGIDFYNPHQNKFLHYGTEALINDNILSSHISVLEADKNGGLWVGDPENGLIHIKLIESRSTKYLPSNGRSSACTFIKKDLLGSIWAVFPKDGLFQCKSDTLLQFISAEQLPSEISCIAHSKEGYVFVGTENNGVYIYKNPEKNIFKPVPPSLEHFQLANDGGGNYIWFKHNAELVRASVKGGAENYHLDIQRTRFDVPSSIVSSFSDDYQNIWVLSRDSVVRCYNTFGQTLLEEKIGSASPCIVSHPHNETILLAQNKSVYKIEAQKQQYSISLLKQFPFYIRNLVRVGNQSFLITSDQSVNIWNSEKDSLHLISELMSALPIHCIKRTYTGDIYIGNNHGLSQLIMGETASDTKLSLVYSGEPIYNISQGSLGYIHCLSADKMLSINTTDISIKWWDNTEAVPNVSASNSTILHKKGGTLLLQSQDGVYTISETVLTEQSYEPNWNTTLHSPNDTIQIHASKDENTSIANVTNEQFPLIVTISDRSYTSIGALYNLVTDEGDTLRSSNGRFHLHDFFVDKGENIYKVYVENKPEEKLLLCIYREKHWLASPWFWLGILAILLGVSWYYRQYLYSRFKALQNPISEQNTVRELYQTKLGFFTEISHEIRTPLTMILDPVDQILRQENLSAFTKERLTVVLENGDKILGLVNRLLDYRKLETGSDHLHAEDCSLGTIIERIANNFSELAIQRSQEIMLHLPEEEIFAWVDKQKFEKILSSVIESTLMRTPEHETIGISLSEEKSKLKMRTLGKLAIRVYSFKYQGEQDSKSSSVEQFFTDTDKNNPDSALGLGLVLAKKLAEMHKGNLYVDAQQGKHFSFKIVLQKGTDHLQKNEMFTAKVQQSPMDAEPELLEQSDKKSILLVEDNANVLAYLDTIFLNKYEVLTAYNGKEGLELAQKHLPDIIVSDIMMPEMDGTEMCRRLKNSHTTAHIPIILLTAKTFTEDQVEGLEAGADDYITKPFKSEILDLKVRNIMQSADRMRKQMKTKLISQPTEQIIESEEDKLIKKLIAYVDDNLDNTEMSVETLAMEMGISRAQLFRKTKAVLAQTPNELIKSMRLKKAEQLLRQGNLRISDISFEVGFQNPQYFSQSFSKVFGHTPSVYLKKVKDGDI